jgi:uncharacterized membrane protein
MLGPLAARPRLTVSLVLGLAVAVIGSSIVQNLKWSTWGILGWDVTCIVFALSVIFSMFDAEPWEMRVTAATQDEGQGFILALVTVAAVASLGAIAMELSLAKTAHGLEKTMRVSLATITVALSWFMVQMIFALHYAHEYYAPDEGPKGDEVVGGLAFPGHEAPDYWDFVHFAVVIGAASQTADIAFTSKALRRVGTVHGTLAFIFNTVVVALTINLLAALF